MIFTTLACSECYNIKPADNTSKGEIKQEISPVLCDTTILYYLADSLDKYARINSFFMELDSLISPSTSFIISEIELKKDNEYFFKYFESSENLRFEMYLYDNKQLVAETRTQNALMTENNTMHIFCKKTGSYYLYGNSFEKQQGCILITLSKK